METRGGGRMTRGVRWVVWASVVGMFVVILMGALVTKTGSADGCGDSWPLCDGQLLPAWEREALIEFSHRVVSGIEGILVVAMAVLLWRGFKQHREIRVLVPLALLFLFLQAALGAMAVVWPQPKTVLALHFGISLVAFATVFLPAVFLEQGDAFRALRGRPVTRSLRRLIWFAALYVYVIVYSGAYVRHTGSDLACPDFPLCNGSLFPGFSGYVGIHFAHRLLAFGGIVLLTALVLAARRMRGERPDIYRGAVWALWGIVLQAASGALSVLSRLALPMMMLHSAIVTLLFGVVTYLCLQSLPPYELLESQPAKGGKQASVSG